VNAAPFWPWWLGAASFAIVTVGCCVVARRPLGVSGVLARFVRLRAELEHERCRRALAADEALAEAAMLAATAEAFGPAAAHDDGAARAPTPPPGPGPIVAGRRGCADCATAGSRPTLAGHAVFLAAIALGGLAGQLWRGGWTPTLDMGPTFAHLFGGGARGALVLAAGGLLVGAGTSLSGGCSTGHGLSGCSRLQPASLAATATYVAAAVLASLLLEGGIR
jgi:uncharacterized protein